MTIKSLSPTALQLYDSCPRCFLLKMEGAQQHPTPQMLYGTKLHKSIENYHKRSGRSVYEEDDVSHFMDLYQEIYTPEFEMCEERLEIPLPVDPDIKFVVRLDLVKNGYIIDHKTSERTMTQDFVDSHRQLTAYSFVFQEITGEQETGIAINLFNTKEKTLEIFETGRSQDNFDEWLDWMNEVVMGIKEDYFDPKPGKWHNYEDCPMYKDRYTVV